MFFGAQIRGIVSDFRSDESFPVKTGSGRKIMVDPSFEPESKGRDGKVTLFLPLGISLPVLSRKYR